MQMDMLISRRAFGHCKNCKRPAAIAEFKKQLHYQTCNSYASRTEQRNESIAKKRPIHPQHKTLVPTDEPTLGHEYETKK